MFERELSRSSVVKHDPSMARQAYPSFMMRKTKRRYEAHHPRSYPVSGVLTLTSLGKRQICKSFDPVIKECELNASLCQIRRSLFGYFCRRCFLSFCKLSFTGVAKLHTDYIDWVSQSTKPDPHPRVMAGYQYIRKDELTNSTQSSSSSRQIPGQSESRLPDSQDFT